MKELTKIDGYEFLCLCGLVAITLAKEVELYFVTSCEVLSCTNQVTFSFPFVQRFTAPEYAIKGELSEKADIYSFGVLVLEIISCRKNTDLTLPSEMQYLPEYVSLRIFVVHIYSLVINFLHLI